MTTRSQLADSFTKKSTPQLVRLISRGMEYRFFTQELRSSLDSLIHSQHTAASSAKAVILDDVEQQLAEAEIHFRRITEAIRAEARQGREIIARSEVEIVVLAYQRSETRILALGHVAGDETDLRKILYSRHTDAPFDLDSRAHYLEQKIRDAEPITVPVSRSLPMKSREMTGVRFTTTHPTKDLDDHVLPIGSLGIVLPSRTGVAGEFDVSIDGSTLSSFVIGLADMKLLGATEADALDARRSS